MKSTKTTKLPADGLALLLKAAMPELHASTHHTIMQNERAIDFYSRLEPFRRKCEARAVLIWIAEGSDINEYYKDINKKRGLQALNILNQDVFALYQEIVARDPSLEDHLVLLRKTYEEQVKCKFDIW